MDTEEKVRENRLRRMAERQGLRLEKSRRRDPLALGYGKYRLLRGGVVVAGHHPHDFALSLREVEEYLAKGGTRTLEKEDEGA